MKKTTLVIAICIALSSCSSILFNSAAGNQPLDTEGSTDIPSPENSDNVVYKTNRVFVYNVTQTSATRELKFKIEMIVVPGLYHGDTKVKYKYHYDPKDLTANELKSFGFDGENYKPEFGSLEESPLYFGLEHPQTNTLACLASSPTPHNPTAKNVNAPISTWLYVPHGNWGLLSAKWIKWTYIIDSVGYRNDKIYKLAVQAKAKSRSSGVNQVNYYYSIDSGLTEMHYNLGDTARLDFVLAEIR